MLAAAFYGNFDVYLTISFPNIQERSEKKFGAVFTCSHFAVTGKKLNCDTDPLSAFGNVAWRFHFLLTDLIKADFSHLQFARIHHVFQFRSSLPLHEIQRRVTIQQFFRRSPWSTVCFVWECRNVLNEKKIKMIDVLLMSSRCFRRFVLCSISRRCRSQSLRQLI